MSFKLIEIEKEKSPNFICWDEANVNRETVFLIYQISIDQYGNKSQNLIKSFDNIIDAKKFLRSCRLVEGIEIVL